MVKRLDHRHRTRADPTERGLISVPQVSIGIVGSGLRIRTIYGPILARLADRYRVVGVTNRSTASGEETAKMLGTLFYRDLGALVRSAHPDLLLVSVSFSANNAIALEAVSTGLPCLLETPAGSTVEAIDALLEATGRLGNLVEVAEQYHRRPSERVKQMLIQAGVFGDIVASYNDFMGHDYHGFNLIRSYVGRDVTPVSVVGQVQRHPVSVYAVPAPQEVQPRPQEEWWRASIGFANGATGHFDFSNLSYSSPLRWERHTRFYGTQGMGHGDELTRVVDHNHRAERIWVERRLHNVGGMEVLDAIAAHVARDTYVWENPFHDVYLDDEAIAVLDGLRVLSAAMTDGQRLDYGLSQARIDQALTGAMRRSAENGNAVVSL